MKYLLRSLPILAVLAVPAAAEFKCEQLDADSSCVLKWGGASGTLQVEDGTNPFSGGPTVTLEWKTPSATAFEQIEAAGCTFTAAGFCNFSIGRGDLKVVVTGGTGADIVSAFVSDEHEAALSSVVSSSGVVAGNLTMADDSWIGLSGAAGRIEFDDQATDEVNIIDANVGIGTSSPSSRLQVIGPSGTTGATVTTGTALHVDNDGNGGIQITTGGSNSAQINFGDAGQPSQGRILYSNVDDSFSIRTVNTEAINIRSDQLVQHVANHGPSPPATCTVNGAPWLDTDETDDTNCTTETLYSLCCCVATDTWQICADPSDPSRAFGSMTFHGIASDTLSISTAAVMTKVTSFTTAKHVDGSNNIIVDVSNDDLEIALAGDYSCAFHISLQSAAGGTRETIMAVGIELATALVITGVTNATPMVVTISSHGLDNGDIVDIVDVVGTTAANGSWIVNAQDANTFEIYDLNGAAGVGNGAYISGGTAPTVYDSVSVAHLEISNTQIVTNSGGVAGAIHQLVIGDKAILAIANLDGTGNYDIDSVVIGVVRLGS